MTDELAWLGSGPHQLLAHIRATVDLERALADGGFDPALVATASVDSVLGARVVVLGEPASIALAEPVTEGPLAATLARAGEGVVGRYVEAPADLATIREQATAAGVRVGGAGDGPFGREVLVIRATRTAPLIVLVEARTVPSRG